MKSIFNTTEQLNQTNQFVDFLNSNSEFEINTDVVLETSELILKISSQFNSIYKENKKRKYLLNEISNYLIKK